MTLFLTLSHAWLQVVLSSYFSWMYKVHKGLSYETMESKILTNHLRTQFDRLCLELNAYDPFYFRKKFLSRSGSATAFKSKNISSSSKGFAFRLPGPPFLQNIYAGTHLCTHRILLNRLQIAAKKLEHPGQKVMLGKACTLLLTTTTNITTTIRGPKNHPRGRFWTQP